MLKMNVSSDQNVKCAKTGEFSDFRQDWKKKKKEKEKGKKKRTDLRYGAHDAVNMKMPICLPFHHSLLLAYISDMSSQIRMIQYSIFLGICISGSFIVGR